MSEQSLYKKKIQILPVNCKCIHMLMCVHGSNYIYREGLLQVYGLHLNNFRLVFPSTYGAVENQGQRLGGTGEFRATAGARRVYLGIYVHPFLYFYVYLGIYVHPFLYFYLRIEGGFNA